MTSISPFVGQFEGSESQRAGQVPQPIGVCFTSKMKSPSVYWVLELMRTEKRPVEAFGTESAVTEVSTRRTALESPAYVKFKDAAWVAGT
jgi:hypothetical protein